MNYWAVIFSEETWEQFRKMGSDTVGFNYNRINTARKIQEGDYLVCYISKHSKITGVLEVVNQAFTENTKIWSQRTFPVRLNVKPKALLNISEGIPIYELKNKLSFFRNLKQPLAWTNKVRSSPTKWLNEDGDIVLNSIIDKYKEKTTNDD